MDLMEIASNLLADKLGINADGATAGLSCLLGNGSGGLDLGAVVEVLGSGGLGDIVGSWLGDGENAAVSPSALVEALGADRIAGAASMMGVDSDALGGGLSEILPQIIDRSSAGGSLLDAAGGLSGLGDLAKRLF